MRDVHLEKRCHCDNPAIKRFMEHRLIYVHIVDGSVLMVLIVVSMSIYVYHLPCRCK